jgi:dTDP-4-dehydrorhamnose 3,5-epimerase
VVAPVKFHSTTLANVRLIETDKRGDERGFFARLYCENEYGAANLSTRFVQVNNSYSAKAGTLRGMHYQLPPAAEVKVVRCFRGALFDVVVDIRPDSPTFGRWFGAELTAKNQLMMYIPRGLAHGFITLTDDTEILYLVSDFYSPENERGIRWNDPKFNIKWPIALTEISCKDASWPDFNPEFHGLERLKGLNDSAKGYYARVTTDNQL